MPELNLNEREDRLRLIIQHSLSESLTGALQEVVTKPTCELIHKNLEKELAQRGSDLKAFEDKVDKRFDNVDNRFNWIYFFMITTLASSVGGLFYMIIMRVK